MLKLKTRLTSLQAGRVRELDDTIKQIRYNLFITVLGLRGVGRPKVNFELVRFMLSLANSLLDNSAFGTYSQLAA